MNLRIPTLGTLLVIGALLAACSHRLCSYQLCWMSAVQVVHGSSIQTHYVLPGITFKGARADAWFALLTEAQASALALNNWDTSCIIHDTSFIFIAKPKFSDAVIFPAQPDWEKHRDHHAALAYVLLSYEPIVIGLVADSQVNQRILGTLRELREATHAVAGGPAPLENPSGVTSITERHAKPATTAAVPFYEFNDRKDSWLLVQGDVVDLELSRVVQPWNEPLEFSAAFPDYPVSVGEAMRRLAAAR